jgi:B12-binding domain/radical SAM domain protein
MFSGPVDAARRPYPGRVPGAVLDLVIRYRKGRTYGLYALLAALEVEPPSVPYEVHLARSAAEVAGTVAGSVGCGRRALTVWSFLSPDAPAMERELREVRAATSTGEVTHLAGGVHASTEPWGVLRAGWDAVVVGEGERAFASIVEAVGTGSGWRGLPGTAYLDGEGALVKGPPAERLPLDRFPSFPSTRNLTSPIEITRGCVYACRFCGTPFLFSARFRHRGIASVREHVRVLRHRGLRDVRFITPTSLSYGSSGSEPDLAAVEELLATCVEGIGPDGRVFFGSFPSELRPEHVTPEAMRLLARYVANREVIIGAQSGSDAVLASSGRGHDVPAVREAVRAAVAAGFRPSVDVIFGMPGESPDDAMASIALVEHLISLGARIHAHTFLPLPGTPWRNEPAGRVPDAARRALATLTASGDVYGSWERQERIAAGLAAVRTPTSGHRPGRPRAPRRHRP